MSALKQTKKITKIIYFNLIYDTVAVIYRKPYIKLSISYLLEKNMSLAKKFLTVNDNPHLRAYRHMYVHALKVLQVFSAIKSKSWLQIFLKHVGEELQVKPT